MNFVVIQKRSTFIVVLFCLTEKGPKRERDIHLFVNDPLNTQGLIGSRNTGEPSNNACWENC